MDPASLLIALGKAAAVVVALVFGLGVIVGATVNTFTPEWLLIWSREEERMPVLEGPVGGTATPVPEPGTVAEIVVKPDKAISQAKGLKAFGWNLLIVGALAALDAMAAMLVDPSTLGVLTGPLMKKYPYILLLSPILQGYLTSRANYRKQQSQITAAVIMENAQK